MITHDEHLRLYRSMLRIRMVEEGVANRYKEDPFYQTFLRQGKLHGKQALNQIPFGNHGFCHN